MSLLDKYRGDTSLSRPEKLFYRAMLPLAVGAGALFLVMKTHNVANTVPDIDQEHCTTVFDADSLTQALETAANELPGDTSELQVLHVAGTRQLDSKSSVRACIDSTTGEFTSVVIR